MATVTAIRERTQNRVAMNRVISYVCQNKKTLYHSEHGWHKLVSGKDCCAETAYSEFMATKQQHDKATGVFFYQYVQSFKPGEHSTPQQINQMGLELAEQFKGHEVLVATHIDADHCHNHLIVNSVSNATGKKLQFNEKDLNRLRQKSDDICKVHGLTVLPAYQKQKKKTLNQREYRAALRGNSWKFTLMAAIDRAIAESRSKAEFVAQMERQGYQVKWEPNHKYITYTTPDGKKCRDIRLHEDKYLKANMEDYYAKLGRTQADQFRTGHTQRTIQTDGVCHSEGTVGSYAESAVGNGTKTVGTESILGAVSKRQAVGDVSDPARGLEESLPFGVAGYQSGTVQAISADDRYNNHFNQHHEQYDGDTFTDDFEQDGEYTSVSGYVGAEAQTQMGRNRGIDFNDVLFLANAIENLVIPYDPERGKQPKKQSKPKKKYKKKHVHGLDDFDISL